MKTTVPIIDIQPLIKGEPTSTVTRQIHDACRETGFFYIVGHGIDEGMQERLEELSARFFALPNEEKMQISMAQGGKAWRGYFPVGDELTSGKPDLKEGLYFGTELQADHPKVRAGVPMHGANLFPEQVPEMRESVLQYLNALTQLGHQLMQGLSLSLGLDAHYFADRFTTDPLTLFRIFHYPAQPVVEDQWGVGEHTDYGVLTILKQDAVGGLQVKTKTGWIEAPYIPGSFVCNIGDMLDRMTGGYYRSTPHRVLNQSGRSRYSFPFFFDPNFDMEVQAIDLEHLNASVESDGERWDGQNVYAFQGTYGDYVLEKVAKVFPQLLTLGSEASNSD